MIPIIYVINNYMPFILRKGFQEKVAKLNDISKTDNMQDGDKKS